ncbi:MAG: T9SS type A sorting domain-containing protein [Bacteroidales bacterium]|nr:T9SS type A sorting domain-containing protein [Bacteroidales bacterium]
MYPNPCTASFRIKSQFPLDGDRYQLTISDMCGKVLADYPLTIQDQLFQMDGPIEAKGIYLVSVLNKQGMIIESRILISR